MPSFRYSTLAKVVLRMGQVGVDLRTDDAVQTDAVNDCIDQASNDAEEHFAQCYTLSDLQTNTFVSDGVTDIAVYYLCFRRMNIPNEGAAAGYEKAIQSFNRVRVGASRIPGVTRLAGA